MHFRDLIDHEEILHTLDKLGFKEPTQIQALAIPEILKGSDLRATSQTGTGKTAAFLLPVLMRLSKEKKRSGPRALILAPTRELAIQLAAEATKLGRNLKLTTVLLYGGVPYHLQYRQLAKPFDILIATPGRLIDHMEQKRVQLNNIEIFILDEADRMLDMGFIEPVETIASKMPSSRQTLMFTATLGKNVRKLSQTLLRNPFEIASDSAETKNLQIDQQFYRTDNLEEKHRRLAEILAQPDIEQMIIFSATKSQTERIVVRLREEGLQAAALHGDMRQNQRTRTIQLFRAGKTRILVATDVAARGIDILTISHVLNFDAPNNLDDYIHRIGRTGRAGGKGVALSFFSKRDQKIGKEIEKFSGVKVPFDLSSPEPKNGFNPKRRGFPKGPRNFGKRPFRKTATKR